MISFEKLVEQLSGEDKLLLSQTRYHVFALDKKHNKLILLDTAFSKVEAESAVAHLPKTVPTLLLQVDCNRIDPDRNMALICLWLVDNDVFGAECSKILRKLEQASADRTIRAQPEWRPH